MIFIRIDMTYTLNMETNKIYQGDCGELIKGLADESVNCVITSPPFFGLRDYGTAKWGGGDVNCDHRPRTSDKTGSSTLQSPSNNNNHEREGFEGSTCPKCGAIRVDAQIGLEESPGQYAEKLVGLFREVRRVLKKDGVVFLNLGDSYAGSGGAHKHHHANPGLSKSSIRSGVQHGVFCDISDKELEGYLMNGCFSQNLCDVCQMDYRNDKFHNDVVPDSTPTVSPSLTNHGYTELRNDRFPTSDLNLMVDHNEVSMRDQENTLNHVNGPNHAFRESTPDGFYGQHLGECLRTDSSFSVPSSDQTSSFDVPESGHMSSGISEKSCCNRGNALPYAEQDTNNQYTSGYCSRCGTYSNNLKTKIQPQSYMKFWGIFNKLKPKDLIGIPWAVAFALRADGWWLRQEITWAKGYSTNKENFGSVMPESVGDRCVKSSESIFLLSKSDKYYFDQDAIKKSLKDSSVSRLSQNIENQVGSCRVPGKTNGNMKAVSSRKRIGKDGYGGSKLGEHSGNYDKDGDLIGDGWANKRSVWFCNTKGTKHAHFATFPEELIVDMVKAGCPKGGVVLDPFMGAGTTGLVARKLGRNYIGFELNPEYIKIAEKRIDSRGIDFWD